MNVVYFKNNYRNGLIYILTYMEDKNNEMIATHCFFDIYNSAG